MSDDVFDELDEKGSRVSAIDDDREAFKDALRAELGKIENGDEQKTISIWDGDMAALVRALEDGDELTELGEDVGTNLQAKLGRDEDVAALDRSDMVRMAFRLGMQQAAPGVIEDLVEVKQEDVAQL